MDLNKQIRKIVVSEKVYKKISQNLANALIMSGYEIEVVPEITAVSYPKRIPPIAATMAIKITYPMSVKF